MVVDPAVSEQANGDSDPASAIRAHKDIKLPELRWQEMPAEIDSAAVSPDGRIWYLMAAADRKQDLCRTRCGQSQSSGSFPQSSPQLQGVKFVFFEGSGGKLERLADVPPSRPCSWATTARAGSNGP